MTNLIDLNDVGQLNKVASYLNEEPDAANNVCAHFPFHQLGELSPMNTEISRAILKLFEIFTKQCDINSHLSPMLYFLSQQITFQADSEECDFELLKSSLEIFKPTLQREYELRAAFVFDSLPATLHSIAHHPEVPSTILELSVQVFSGYIQRSIKNDANFGKVCSGMWKAAESLTILRRLALLRSLICNKHFEDNPDAETGCTYLIDVLKLLNNKSDPPIVAEILKCILEMYENSETKSSIMALSVQLASIHFPTCLADYFLADVKHLPQMHEILFHVINTIFYKTPWHSTEDNLREIITNMGEKIITNMGEKHLVKPDPDEKRPPDIVYVLYYLELLYSRTTHRSIPIIKDMVNRFNNKLTTNPALLKSLYLLFAAYGGTELDANTRSLQCDLLLSLQHSDNLEDYLSFHVAEVIWVLRFGSRILKKKVVSVWLRQKNSDVLGCLSRCLRECNQLKCLLEVICCDDASDVRAIAMDMFVFCTPNPRAQLTPLLMRSDLTIEALDCIMYANPGQIVLGDPDDFTYKDNLATLKALILRLIEFMTQEELGLRGRTKSKLFLYLLESCKTIRKTQFASCFVVKKLAKMVANATKSTIDKIASHAYQFLMLIITTQEELKMTFSEPIAIDSRSLLDASTMLVSCAVKFYQHILESPNSDRQRVIILNSHLQLYHHLLEVLTGEAGAAVYQLVVILLERYETCVSSFMNLAAIRTLCREGCSNVNFIKYLTTWYQLATTNKHIMIPVRSIVPLIKYLDTIKYRDADYAILKTMC